MVFDVVVILVASLIDSVNPCTFAIFFFLMANLVQTKKKSLMIKSAIGFITAIFISYTFIGLGLIHAYKFIGFQEVFYYLIATGALIVGVLNLKNYFQNKGSSCSYNSKLQKALSKASNPFSMVVAGFFCSLFLLPCTSGPYVVITGLIAQNQFIGFLGLLLLYNVVFILPLVVIACLSIYGLGSKFQIWQLTNQRKVDLVSGLLMIVIGLYLIIYNLLLVSSTCVI